MLGTIRAFAGPSGGCSILEFSAIVSVTSSFTPAL